jgi:hypothetical protein
VVVKRTDPMQGEGKLVLACAGDFIIWDSRTVHGGLVGALGDEKNQSADSTTLPCVTPPRLARLAQTICMTPRSKASKMTLQKRKQGFQEGKGYSHWPHELHVTAHGGPGHVPITLTAEQEALL